MNSHLKNTLTLLTGSGISQIIPLISAPIVAKYYSPEAFGILGSFIGISSTLAILFHARYDLAIIETKFKVEAYQILKGTFFFGIVLMFVCYLTIISFLFIYKKEFELRNLLLLIPISSFIISQNNCFNAILNRQKRFKLRSSLLILNNSSQIFLSLILKSLGKVGLVLGNVIGTFLILSIHLKNNTRLFLRSRTTFDVFKKYINFPKFILPSTLLEKVSTNLPLIFMLDTFGALNTGLFVFASRITSAPIAMLTMSISEVYMQKASELFNNGKSITKLYFQTLVILGALSVFIFAFLNIGIEYLVEYFFDSEYFESVKIIKILSLMIILSLCSSSLSYTIVYANFHKYDTLLQVIRLFMVTISIFIGNYFGSFDLFLKCFVVSYSLFYISHTLLQFYSLRIINHEKRVTLN